MNNFLASFARRRLVFWRILLVITLLISLSPHISASVRAEDSAPAAPAENVSTSEEIQAAPPVTGTHPVATLGCKFSGNNSEPKPLSYFTGLTVSSTPGSPTYSSLDHYFRSLSYQQMSLTGSQTFGWFTLPASFVPGNITDRPTRKNMAQACINAAEATVNFNNFKIINVVVNATITDNILGETFGSRETLTLEGSSRDIPLAIFSPVPPATSANPFPQALFAQKMLWALRSSLGSINFFSLDVNGNQDNIWDGLMRPLYECTGLNLDATYGCIAQQPIAFHKDQLGWIPPARIWSPRPDVMTQTFTLQPQTETNLATGLPRLAIIPIKYSATDYYMIEVRTRTNTTALNPYDHKLTTLPVASGSMGVVIHRVTLTSAAAARLQKPDGVVSTNATDAYLNEVAGRNKFTGEAGSGIVIEVLSRSSNSFDLRVRIPTDQVPFVEGINLDISTPAGFVNTPGGSVWWRFDVPEPNWYAIDVLKAPGGGGLNQASVTLFGPEGLRPIASGSGPRNGKLNEVRPIWLLPARYYIRIFAPTGASPQTGIFELRVNRPLTVRKATDDADLHSLSYAADMVLPGQKITFLPGITEVTTSRTITLTPGVALEGTTTCNAAGIVSVVGTGTPLNTIGLLLQGDNQVTGMRVRGFGGNQIKTTGRNNDLSCVRASKN
jgi:hypothetical protein